MAMVVKMPLTQVNSAGQSHFAVQLDVVWGEYRGWVGPVKAPDSPLRRLAAWGCYLAYNTASNSVWSWRAPILIQALGPLLQLVFIR